MSDETRTFVHGLWESVADNWIDRADYLEARAAAVTKALLDRAALAPQDRVLALADGAGSMALAAAPLVREVVTSDIVASLVAAAELRARENGLDNLTAAVLDIEDIAVPDNSFDVVVSREGLMFAVEPQRAFDEVARVLRSGGRLAAAVWAAPDRNPWLTLVMAAVAEIVGHPVPPAGMPGPFALSDETALAAYIGNAGFTDCTIDHVAVPFHAPSFDAWVEHTTALAGPIARIVDGFDNPTRARFLDGLREGVAPYVSTDGVDIPGVSLVLSATKP